MSDVAPLRSLQEQSYHVCITSFLAGTLRVFGSLLRRKDAKEYLRFAGKDIEIFLPFYKWFDREGEVRKQAMREFSLLRRLYGMERLRAVHAGYAGRGFLLARYYFNPADPSHVKENIKRLRSELHLLHFLREELHISHPLLYVLHCGDRPQGVGWRESFQATVATVRDVLPAAEAAGVCISLENLYSHPGQERIGTTLADIGTMLTQLGLEWVERGVLGWTFDPSHALLAYSGNYEAIERDVVPLLKHCVHLHSNHPRITKDRTGKLFSEWGRGDDYHAAPVRIPHRTRYWELLKTTIQQSRIPQWRTVTYEVNWALPGLEWMVGGSSIADMRVGHDALLRFCNHETEAFDVPAIERYIDSRLAEVK